MPRSLLACRFIALAVVFVVDSLFYYESWFNFSKEVRRALPIRRLHDRQSVHAYVLRGILPAGWHAPQMAVRCSHVGRNPQRHWQRRVGLPCAIACHLPCLLFSLKLVPLSQLRCVGDLQHACGPVFHYKRRGMAALSIASSRSPVESSAQHEPAQLLSCLCCAAGAEHARRIQQHVACPGHH